MEEWRDIEGFEGYQVSNKGRVRTFWKKKHYPTGYGTYRYLSDDPRIMSTSDDGNGYQKLMLYDRSRGRRYCRKVHKLVADAFIPNDDPTKDTVDHKHSGPEGKLDNSVENLRWMPRPDNIRKAYRDGMCDARIRRQCKNIMVVDNWTGDEAYFDSIKEASEELGIPHSSISHALNSKTNRISHYTVGYADREDRLLYGDDENKLLSWIRFGLR